MMLKLVLTALHYSHEIAQENCFMNALGRIEEKPSLPFVLETEEYKYRSPI